MSEIDPYAILQVDPAATHDVIAAAYRALARRFHPDVLAGPEAPQRMVVINAAWELVGDARHRVVWDLAHGGTARAVRGAATGAPGDATPAAGPHAPGDHRWGSGLRLKRRRFSLT